MPIVGIAFTTVHLKKRVSCSIGNATHIQKAIVLIAYKRSERTLFCSNFVHTSR